RAGGRLCARRSDLDRIDEPERPVGSSSRGPHASRGNVLMYDAPAFGTAVPDECAAPTTQHIAIRPAPEDRERAAGDFTEAVDADLLWSHSRVRRQRPEHRFLLVLGRREAEQLPARLAGPAAD